MTAEEHSDTELVSRSLAGDRDAFSRIVARYQTLICSLAYSRICNLGQSEGWRVWTKRPITVARRLDNDFHLGAS